MQEVNKKIDSLLAVGFHDTDKNLLAEIYKEVFSETLDIKCNKCIYQARIRLKHYLVKPEEAKINYMAKNKYQFKKGCEGYKIQMKTEKGGRILITKDSLTDEIAERLLAENKGKNDYADIIELIPVPNKEEKDQPKK
jgi:hypothetical protein